MSKAPKLIYSTDFKGLTTVEQASLSEAFQYLYFNCPVFHQTIKELLCRGMDEEEAFVCAIYTTAIHYFEHEQKT